MILIKDKDFIRGNCPMTKEDIRALSIWKMNLEDNSTVLDVGSGTGSITVQAAKIAKNGLVYSIERDDEAYDTTVKNLEKFKCDNVILEKGLAEDILDSYLNKNIKFDSIFIGGSGGSLDDIIKKSDRILKENGCLVMNFITLDNAYKGMEEVKSLGYNVDVSLVNISKNRGKSYMMIANNPIYIVKCFKEEF